MKSILTIGIMIIALGLSAQPADVYARNGDKTHVTRYYEDGTVKEKGTFLGAKADGKWTQYNIDGSVQMEGFYEEGSKEGKWYVYSNCGKFLYEVVYEENRLKNSNRWKIEERDLLAGK